MRTVEGIAGLVCGKSCFFGALYLHDATVVDDDLDQPEVDRSDFSPDDLEPGWHL
jgi:hypothetical protein